MRAETLSPTCTTASQLAHGRMLYLGRSPGGRLRACLCRGPPCGSVIEPILMPDTRKQLGLRPCTAALRGMPAALFVGQGPLLLAGNATPLGSAATSDAQQVLCGGCEDTLCAPEVVCAMTADGNAIGRGGQRSAALHSRVDGRAGGGGGDAHCAVVQMASPGLPMRDRTRVSNRVWYW